MLIIHSTTFNYHNNYSLFYNFQFIYKLKGLFFSFLNWLNIEFYFGCIICQLMAVNFIDSNRWIIPRLTLIFLIRVFYNVFWWFLVDYQHRHLCNPFLFLVIKIFWNSQDLTKIINKLNNEQLFD